MERTPEPELMDEQKQAAAYASADWSASHGKIPGFFRERFPEFERGRLIDLGCGAADVTIRFAKAFPAMTALGVDGSDAMLEIGRRDIGKFGLDSRIVLENRFLPDAQLEKRGFDAVISNSLLHHVADPPSLWRTAALCAKPGGAVLLVDLLRPSDEETLLLLVRKYAEDAMPILRRDFAASLHAAYTVEEVERQLSAARLANFQIDQTDELHFVVWGRAPEVYPE